MQKPQEYWPAAGLDALERRHTGPPPRQDWLEARFGGPAALAALRVQVRSTDAGRAAGLYRRAIACLRRQLVMGTEPDGHHTAHLAGLSAALQAVRAEAVASGFPGARNWRGIG